MTIIVQSADEQHQIHNTAGWTTLRANVAYERNAKWAEKIGYHYRLHHDTRDRPQDAATQEFVRQIGTRAEQLEQVAQAIDSDIKENTKRLADIGFTQQAAASHTCVSSAWQLECLTRSLKDDVRRIIVDDEFKEQQRLWDELQESDPALYLFLSRCSGDAEWTTAECSTLLTLFASNTDDGDNNDDCGDNDDETRIRFVKLLRHCVQAQVKCVVH